MLDVEITKCEGCGRCSAASGSLCAECTAVSARVDVKLATTRSGDPVVCDGCAKSVDFDARVAVVTRECGGSVLCDRCKPVSIEGAPAS